jgi:eukaryotic-like serine/threonine-protein kinase
VAGSTITNPSPTDPSVVTFLRRRDYNFVRELGRGACGRTVLLHDDVIDEHLVCKKFDPSAEEQRSTLFTNFLREIKLLHSLHHANVVRVFNYYVYPDQFIGYILMEFVRGTDIEDYGTQNPEKINELFLQAIEGFAYLEASRILHRDIRPQNLMVTDEGILKVIDLGFGKRVRESKDFDKSISLNWWCDPPQDFDEARYDFATEVYFVGKLFEKILRNNGVLTFQYTDLLRQMCTPEPDRRLQSFATVAQNIRSDRFSEISFNDADLQTYREFSDALCEHITKINGGTKYVEDKARIERELGDAYRNFMLEKAVPHTPMITQCFLDGTYYYSKRLRFPVPLVKRFLTLLKSCNHEQGRIILANLHTKMDTITRYFEAPPDFDAPPDDDVPF